MVLVSGVFSRMSKHFCCLLGVFLSFTATPVSACSRVVYRGPDDAVIVGRTMDWSQSLEVNLWAFPAGLERNGNAGDRSLKWTSKYGSVAATCYDKLVADGMNEKGLVVNVLYLSSSIYPQFDGSRPTLSIGAWAQYVLDSFATVNEAVTVLKDEPFQLGVLIMPGGHAGTVHLAIADATGDSAIFEYIGGKLLVHHGKQYSVMTNDPQYDQQLALNSYWREVGGNVMLPGTERPADRFVRASLLSRRSRRRHLMRESRLPACSRLFEMCQHRLVQYTPGSRTWRQRYGGLWLIRSEVCITLSLQIHQIFFGSICQNLICLLASPCGCFLLRVHR